MASLTYDLTLAGLAVGSAAALTGIGLIVTYRATGVLNLAHGAIAMVCAYVLRQLVVVWHWPLPLGALVTLLVVAPGLGLVLDRLVFRPLAVAGAGPAQTLVASIGVFVLLVGAAALVWGDGARDDAPVLLGDDPWAQLAAAVALACMMGAVTRWTRFGRELRAVVDNRPLAVLSGIPADRVVAAGWAFGSFTAGLTGVLLAPYVRLDPYGMPLLVVEVIAVAVVARMRSLPVAVLTALALGVAQAQLTRLHPGGVAGELLQAAGANLFVIALLVAALVLPGVGDTDALPPPRAAPRVPVPVWLVTAVLLLLPLGFAGEDLTTAVQVPALAVILLSLVVVAGRGGQIALGQAAYAGLGALFTALLAAAGLPELVALGVAVLCVAPLGLLTGWPAIRRHGPARGFRIRPDQRPAPPELRLGGTPSAVDRKAEEGDDAVGVPPRPQGRGGRRRPTTTRRGAVPGVGSPARSGSHGLALALATLAVGVAVSRFVFAQPYATAGVTVSRPAGFSHDRAYYVLELLLLAGCLLLVAALRRGRTGRALAALRDHEPGAEAAGVPVAALKLLAFTLGSALAALGGALLAMSVRAFDPDAFDPVRGLLWFAAVLTLGADTLLTPLLAATLLVTLDAGTHAGVAVALIGLLAALTGRVPPLLPWLLRGAGALAPHRAAPGGAADHAPAGNAPLPGATARSGAVGTGHRAADGAGAAAPPGRRSRGAARLVAEGVRLVHAGGTVALDGVDIAVPVGAVSAVVGVNGAGKSTLFDCLAGAMRPTAGRVVLDGVDVTGKAAHARQRLGVGRTFQQLAVFPSLSVEENVRVGGPGAEQALRLFGLDGAVRHRAAAGLPTGTLRRVELARALAGRPHTLLLDEPAAGLDAAEAAALARILAALAADGLAVLVVEHDPDLVAGIARTVHTMEGGRFV
ncbi:ATP-binding cassette domain-containing protein [Streptomyces fradiae]|uniref:ABC transporter permease subunit n=1 Tax=Streptomyces fradiae TaxID=1906 RepID=UPI00351346B1